MQQDGVKVAWYAIDEQDNDPIRFAAYLINAFREFGDLQDLPPRGERINLQDAITLILNAIAQCETQFSLVLDDYHLITAPQIHDAISRMCEYLPLNMRVAVGTRADPPLQLARLRARGEIAEIRMTDLRFRPAELNEWLQSSLGWMPSEQTLKQLEALTEGWAAALSLIIMALNKNMAGANEQTLKNQLERYSQTQRHIFEYFAQEVLEEQSAKIRQFLLDTCVLNRLHPHLCSALTNDCGAPLLLNQIAAESLFVIPLSNVEPVYRYHHLFEDFLRQYLQMQDEAHYFQQHRRAAAWFAEHDDIVEAVHHALEARDDDFAASLIQDVAWEELTSRGEIMTVIHWLPRFSDEALRQSPRLCLYFSRALYLTGEIERSERYIQIAVGDLDQPGIGISERKALEAIAYNYQATLAAYRGDVTGGLALNAQAAALRQHVAAIDQVRIANTGAYLQFLRGDAPAARQAYEHALDLAQQLDHHYLMLDAHCYLAQIDLITGQLRSAQDRCETVLAAYPNKIAPLSAIMLPLAHVLYEQNQLLEAELLLHDAIVLAERGHIPDVLWSAYTLLAGLLATRGAHAEAQSYLQQARQAAAGFRSPVMQSLIEAMQARAALQADQMDKAAAWAERYQQTAAADYQRDYETMTLARVWLVQGNAGHALDLLTPLLETMRNNQRMGHIIEAELLRALACQAAGDSDAALSALDAALQGAQAEGFVRVFLDGGQPMLALIRQAVEHDIAPDYAQYLLDHAKREDSVPHPADALTDREIEVLRQIAAGASNQAIASTLVISLGTVKSHIHHIMNKLDAQNRTEAVNKARSLKLLDD